MSAAMNAIAEAARFGSTNAPGIGELGTGLSPFAPNRTSTGAKETPFSNLLTDAIDQVNGLETRASAAVDGLITGSGVDVHQAMIAAEKASMAFELALAVRNKAVQAYQSVMAMPF